MSRLRRGWVAAALVVLLVAGVAVLFRTSDTINRTNVVAYFENSNGIYVGDDVRILGVNVGKIAEIEPQPDRVKISFWYDSKYKVPADAKAAILSPTLVTARAIQLTPVYTGGPVMARQRGDPARAHRGSGGVGRPSAQQLEKLANESAADRARRREPAWVRSSTPPPTTCAARAPTSATPSSSCRKPFRRSAITAPTSSRRQEPVDPGVGAAGQHQPDASAQPEPGVGDRPARRQSQRSRQRGTGPQHRGRGRADVSWPTTAKRLGTTSDKLAGVTQALTDSLDDVKQFLHVAPTTLQNYINIYQPAQGAASAVLAVNNFANPITFLCGAIQAASRLGAEQSAKLCVQYLAPIIKNRQYNFPPIGQNLFVGATARPNEITYSEDWMRPDYIPPQPPPQSRRRRPRAGLQHRRHLAHRWRRRRPSPPTRPTGCPADGAPGSRTMMRAKWLRVAASLLVAGLALAGCGGGAV